MIICVILLIVSLLANLYFVRSFLEHPNGPATLSAMHGQHSELEHIVRRVDESQKRKESFRRSVQSLRDRLKYRLQQQHSAPGKIIDEVFEDWLSTWEEDWD